MPIALGWYIGPRSLADATRVMKSGNGYTFALALLATSAAFLINDAIDAIDRTKKTDYHSLRVFASLLAIALLIALVLFSGAHFLLAKVVTGSAGSGAIKEIGGCVGEAGWTGRETWQLVLVLATVMFGVWLFCLQHADFQEADLFQTLRDDKTKLVSEASHASNGSGIEA